MAVVNIREVYPAVSLGLWQVDETVEDMYERYPWASAYKDELEKNYKSDERKLEFLIVRALLREMLKNQGCAEGKLDKIANIRHNKAGKPLMDGFHVSVSHTKGFVAVIISRKQEVAVDIEYFSDRVKKVASKFLRKDEKADDLDSLLVHWCAKETMYKLFSEENLQFQEMRVKPFDTMSDWNCVIENLKSHKTLLVDFELTMEFVLTYAAQ